VSAPGPPYRPPASAHAGVLVEDGDPPAVMAGEELSCESCDDVAGWQADAEADACPTQPGLPGECGEREGAPRCERVRSVAPHDDLGAQLPRDTLALRACAALRSLQLGGYAGRSSNRLARLAERRAGRETQRGRMRMYEAAAGSARAGACVRSRVVAFSGEVCGRTRTSRRHGRSRVQVAAAEASAFCLPSAGDARLPEFSEGHRATPEQPVASGESFPHAAHWASQVNSRGTRTSRRHGRSSVQVAAAEASALCLPSAGDARSPAFLEGERATLEPPVASGESSPHAAHQATQVKSRDTGALERPLRVLVLFAGPDRAGSLPRYLREQGHVVVTFERLDGSLQDLSVPALQHELLGRVQGGEFDAVFAAPPCASFSVALDVPLRSRLEPEGLSTLGADDRAYVETQNALVAFTARVCRAADVAGAAWAIENPASRRAWPCRWAKYVDRGFIWDMPAMEQLSAATRAARVTFAQCQFSAPWQKYTSLLVSRTGAEHALRRFGNALCSCEHHDVVLHGVDPATEQLRTAQAAAYPPALCAAFGDWLVEACVRTAPRAARPCATALCLGSADPHGLRLEDDRVVPSRRASAFNVAGHLTEAGADLESEALPEFNVAPEIAPGARPEAPALREPPAVRSLSDLLPGCWVRKVRRWRRQVGRCIRLAEAGDWRAARRVRPSDLWVPASAMLPQTAGFDWDLRPWAVGNRAIPMAQSAAAAGPVASSLNRALLEEELRSGEFTDRAILREALDGIADDVVAERGSFLCAPHSGALRFFAEAQERLQVGVAAGWATEYAELPFWPLRCDPYSVVDESARAGKPKFRLTNDHSWPPPAPGAVPSLNGSMDRSAWPAGRLMRVKSMARAAAILQTSGVPVKMAVLDVVAYYKQLLRRPAEWHRNGSFTRNGVLIDERCCFGSAADACKCSRFSNFVVHRARRALRRVDEAYPTRDRRVLGWLQARADAAARAGATEQQREQRWCCLHAAGMYIDDESIASIDDAIFLADGSPMLRGGVQVTRATLHFEAVLHSMRELGLEPTKLQPPSTSVELLGAVIDLESATVTLSVRKRASYSEQALALAAAPTCSRDELHSLLSKLNFAADFYPVGRQWLHAAWRALRARFRTQLGVVVLSKSARGGLRRWAAELQRAEHAGVPLAARERYPRAGEQGSVVIYADASRDASASCGYCAWTVHGGELLFVEGRWSAEERQELLICDLELAASTLGMVTLAPEVGGDVVYSFTDNEVAKAAMRSLTPSTLAMQTLAAARTAWLFERGMAEKAERVTSAANLWADLGSRAEMAELLAQAEQLGLRARRLQPPADWRALVAAEAERARAARPRHAAPEGASLR
jgi:hypothetical protein